MAALIELIKQPQILIGICIIIIGIIGIISWLISPASPPRSGRAAELDKQILTKIDNLEKSIANQKEFFSRVEKCLGELPEKFETLNQQYQENKSSLNKLSEEKSGLPQLIKHQEERLSTLQNMFENLDAQLVKLNQFFAQLQKK